MITTEALRSQFPFFAKHPGIAYLDSAATTQKPQSVIDAITKFYEAENANASRGVYPLGSMLTARVEQVRGRVAQFIGCSADEVFFTAGATASYEVLARLIEHLHHGGDTILYSRYDHQSFVQPFQRMAQRLARNDIHVKLRGCAVTNKGDVDIAELTRNITPSTKLIVLSHIHNIFGADTDPAQIPHTSNAIVVMDITQSVSCGFVDMQTMPHVDAAAFSGHKMFAAQGVGVLVLRKSLQQRIARSPEIVAGETLRATIEAGTQNWAGIISLEPAITFIEHLGREWIHERQAVYTQRIIDGLRSIPGVTFTPGPSHWTCRDGYGIVAFRIDGVASSDIGFALAEQNIYVRAGTHCSVTDDTQTDSVRISTHIYTTDDEIDRVIDAARVIAACS